MKALFSTAISLFASMAMATAASTPTKFTSDALEFGHYGSTANKSLIYNFGLSTNPTTSVDNSTHTWSYNFNGLEFGDGTSSDKTITANLGGTTPKITYSAANSQWQFSNDGTNFSAFGSGSGGSGINLLQNPGFESGVSLWTTSGLTSAVVSSGSNLLFDKKSVTLTASATGQYFEQSVVIPGGLGGSSQCAVSVYYLGGDANISMHFTDSSNNDLAPSLPLYPVTSTKQLFINAPCPAAAASAKIRFVSTSSTALVSIDNATLGSATNSFQVSQASLLGAITASGCASAWTYGNSAPTLPSATTGCTYSTQGVITAPSTMVPGFIIPNAAPGVYKVVFTGGLATLYGSTNYALCSGSASKCAASGSPTSFTTAINAIVGLSTSSSSSTSPTAEWSWTQLTNTTNLELDIYGQNYNSSGGFIYNTTDYPASFAVYYYPSQQQTAYQLNCASSGTCVNHLSASVNTVCSTSPCTITAQNVPWVSSVTRTGTGAYIVNFNTGFFSVAPICSAGPLAGTANNFIGGVPSSASMTINTQINGTTVDSNFSFSCDKQGADIASAPAPVMTYGAGSVQTTSSVATRIEYLFFGGASNTVASPVPCTSSPCTVTDSSMSVTVTRATTGTYSIIPAVPWGGKFYCFGNSPGLNTSLVPQATSTNAHFDFTLDNTGSGSPFDTSPNIICIGPQ
jgi:hypothetical protein